MDQALNTLGCGAGLLSFYYNKKDADLFLVGYIMSYDSNEIVLYAYSPEAEYDGLCFCKVHSIYRIEQHSRYLRDIENKLDCSAYASIHNQCDNPWDCFLQQTISNDHNIIIHCLLEGKDVRGVLVSYTDSVLILKRVKSDGSLGREYLIHRDKVVLMAHELRE